MFTKYREIHSPSHHNPNLLDPLAASKFLKVTRGILAGWRCTKRYALPFVRIGRTIRHRESVHLLNFLEQATVRQSTAR